MSRLHSLYGLGASDVSVKGSISAFRDIYFFLLSFLGTRGLPFALSFHLAPLPSTPLMARLLSHPLAFRNLLLHLCKKLHMIRTFLHFLNTFSPQLHFTPFLFTIYLIFPYQPAFFISLLRLFKLIRLPHCRLSLV